MDLIQLKTLSDLKNLKSSQPRQMIYFLAGGTDLMVQYKEDLLQKDALLVDISSLKELNFIKEENNRIRIGSLTTFTDILKNKVIKRHCEALTSCAGQIGSLQIQNRATIGGNIANASPAGDSIPTLYVYRSMVKTNFGIYPVEKIFKGVKKTQLKKNECILEIIIPKSIEKHRSFFFKSGPREALAISKASLALKLSVEKSIIKEINIAAGAVGITVISCYKTGQYLTKKKINKEIIENAKRLISQEISPIDDFRSTALFRSNFVEESLSKALQSVLKKKS
ncbi:MAG: FAD binding domain-containing protein [Spirochaetes bacterium]|nr:FAD binding domain-containing protein [Spirochaetota bacterium]